MTTRWQKLQAIADRVAATGWFLPIPNPLVDDGGARSFWMKYDRDRERVWFIADWPDGLTLLTSRPYDGRPGRAAA